MIYKAITNQNIYFFKNKLDAANWVNKRVLPKKDFFKFNPGVIKTIDVNDTISRAEKQPIIYGKPSMAGKTNLGYMWTSSSNVIGRNYPKPAPVVNPVNPVKPVNPINPVNPVNPVNPQSTGDNTVLYVVAAVVVWFLFFKKKGKKKGFF